MFVRLVCGVCGSIGAGLAEAVSCRGVAEVIVVVVVMIMVVMVVVLMVVVIVNNARVASVMRIGTAVIMILKMNLLTVC